MGGGLAAIMGGLIFVGGLMLFDVHGIRTMSSADGWVRPLAQFGGIVGCFGMLGFATGPIMIGLGKRRDGAH